MRRFEKEDLADANEWRIARGLQPWPESVLPAFGLFVEEVAAGFIYVTDSDMALLEGYVTNPDASPEARNQALDEVTDGLLARCKALGMKRVVAFARDSSIVNRAISKGLHNKGPYTMLVGGL